LWRPQFNGPIQWARGSCAPPLRAQAHCCAPYRANHDSRTYTHRQVHHIGHHNAYLKTINTALAALRGNPDTNYLAKMGLDKLLQNLDKVPEDLRGPVRNGGVCKNM